MSELMHDTLNTDVLDNIVSNLDYKSLYNLTTTSKRNRNYFFSELLKRSTIRIDNMDFLEMIINYTDDTYLYDFEITYFDFYTPLYYEYLIKLLERSNSISFYYMIFDKKLSSILSKSVFPNLKKVKFESCKFENTIFISLQTTPNIEKLTIHDMSLLHNIDIKSLKNLKLKTLYLPYLNISNSKSIETLKSLNLLDISYSNLDTFDITKLTNLQTLNISTSHLSLFPIDIESIPNLQVIVNSEDDSSDIPEYSEDNSSEYSEYSD